MTVGIGAISEYESEEPKVVISSDRLVTTHQQSAIEHERPEKKIKEIAVDLHNTHLAGVIAGSVQLGEEFEDKLESALHAWVREHETEPWVQTAANIAGETYREFVQEKIEHAVLQPYGLEISDLSKQHKFKDSFFQDVMSEVQQFRSQVQTNLVLLLGGVADKGAGLYEIRSNDVLFQNDMGYATIGSGTQPAKSEFIKTEYGKSCPLSEALATVAAANYQAQRASGVGGSPDIIIVDSDGVHALDDGVRKRLMDRQEDIDDRQEEIKHNILDENEITWRSGGT